jgi:GR25 family glycosyltransferase involved in LPS biosynthesis
VGGGELLRVVSDVDFQMFNRHSTCYENTSLIGPRSSGLYGYLISRDGASKALSLAKFLDVPIDIFVLKNSLVFGGILKVVVTDTLVDHEGVAPSEIGDLRIIASGRGGAGVK